MTTPGDALLLGAYVPGRSWLHRAPTGAKLGGLALFGIGLALVPGRVGWVAGSLAFGAVVVVALSARLPLGLAFRALRALLVLGLAVAVYQVWRSGWQVALGVLSTLMALVLAGLVVTMTTPMDSIIEVVVRASRPLRRFGLKPEWVGLAFALTLRGIPALVEIVTEARDAARARGLDRDPRAILVPAVVRTVARARTTGEALAARGLAD